MNVEPGIGAGPIKYGITQEELITFIGNPDRIDQGEYVAGKGDWYKVLWYTHKNIQFTFDVEDDYRLGLITIMGTGYPLFGGELFGLPLESVKRFIAKTTGEIARLEDWTSYENETHKCLEHDGLGILFWFDEGCLSEMQCSYLFESDNETALWP